MDTGEGVREPGWIGEEAKAMEVSLIPQRFSILRQVSWVFTPTPLC